MRISICGSMAHEPAMAAAQESLQEMGYDVERPNVNEGELAGGVLVAPSDSDKRRYIDEHLRKIDPSDAILVINETKNGIAG